MLEVKAVDRDFYAENLERFMPDRIIDIHTHVWLDNIRIDAGNSPVRAVTWPSLVAKQNSIDELKETYQLMFPGKTVTPMIFTQVGLDVDIDAGNSYIKQCAADYSFPSLMVTKPETGALKFEEGILKGGFLGCKVYLNFAAAYIPEKEIRIYDFLPPHQLDILNKHGWIAMLHIPRDGRLGDPVNLMQMLEIEKKYPDLKLIIAHVGRAYCPEDVGDAMEILSKTKNMVFDISANTNSSVFRQLINAVGPQRILFGSDLPILKMRTRRICENADYVNLVPKGLYGDVSGDRHMREVEGEEGENITFFMYEEIDAFRVAAQAEGLNQSDVEDVFYNTAKRIINGTDRGIIL
ncbi:MAG: amidohydrolase family protein [Saccharofermentanales bacterium]